MVGDLGLLTREGIESFYPIFKDMENWMDDDYKDPFPKVPFADKPKGIKAANAYKKKLEEVGASPVPSRPVPSFPFPLAVRLPRWESKRC
jgi:hypothetical protein